MKAIILAAGRGSRMGDSTKDKPKCLNEVFGKTLIEQQLEKLREAGVDEIGVVRGYMPHMIDFNDLTYFENTRWSESNMVTSLCCAKDWLENDDCIICYSDILFEAKAIESLIKSKEDIAITYNTNWLELWTARFEDPLSDAETFELDESSYVKVIGGRATSTDQIKGQYMGLLKFSKEGWNQISNYLNEFEQNVVDKMDMTSLLSNLIQRGIKIYGIPYDGLWLEVDNENDRDLYEKMYKGI